MNVASMLTATTRSGEDPALPRVIAPSSIAAEGAYWRPIRHRRWHLSLVVVRKVTRPVDGLATNDSFIGACLLLTVLRLVKR